MRYEIDCIGQEIVVEVFHLVHGFRVDAHAMIGGRRTLFREHGASVSSAIGKLKIGITHARDASAIRYIRERDGFKLVDAHRQ